MTRKYTQLMFTESVKQTQADFGSRKAGVKAENREMDDEHLSSSEIDFIAERDGFYQASVNGDGWPYVQFRGGPPGFLKALDDVTLAYGDYSGNRQFVSVGNLRENDRAALLFMDYANQRRLKIMVRTEVHTAEERPDLVALVKDPDYSGRIERVIVFAVEAFDWNCPLHITPRFTQAEWQAKSSDPLD